jgi:DNA-binding response OmpR family regulator
MGKHILLLEDDVQLSQSISQFLETNGYSVSRVYDGSLALRTLAVDAFDLALLDVNVPGLNGLELCKAIRQNDPNLPLIIITAFGDIDTKMDAFNAGADDYLVKPFHLRELIAKVKVFIRRSESTPISDGPLVAADLTVDTHTKKVIRCGVPIDLTPKEFSLLEYLLRNKGRVLSKDELARNVWDEDLGVSGNSIEVYISFIRNKIDKNADIKLIKTKTGFGYYIDEAP